MKHRNNGMFKLIKYIILALLIIALIYFLKVSFKNNSMQITLKNPQKLQNIEQKTIELKKKFTLLNNEAQQPTTTVKKEEKSNEDKQGLDRFIQEHSK
jgi:hypothetical protein